MGIFSKLFGNCNGGGSKDGRGANGDAASKYQGSNADGTKTVHDQRRRLSVQNDPNIGKLVYEGVSEAANVPDAGNTQHVFDSQIATIDQFFRNKGGRKNSLRGETCTKKESTYADKVEVAQTKDAFPAVIGHQCRKGRKPESPNQDSFSITVHEGVHMQIYCVFDGHGPFGHEVSEVCANFFVKKLCQNKMFQSCFGLRESKLTAEDYKQIDFKIESAIRAVFEQVEGMVVKQTKSIFMKQNTDHEDCPGGKCRDVRLSGSTATVVVRRGNKLYFAWVGDSSAVLLRKNPNRKKNESLYQTVYFTKDHKPNDPKEKQRIIASKGEVRKMKNDIPHRVFMKGQPFPGLAMSRAIGDFEGKKCGVVATPEFAVCECEVNDCLIVASDGVWEFIDQNTAVAPKLNIGPLVDKFEPDQAEECARSIFDESKKRWILEEGQLENGRMVADIVDDITVIVSHLQEFPPMQESDSEEESDADEDASPNEGKDENKA